MRRTLALIAITVGLATGSGGAATPGPTSPAAASTPPAAVPPLELTTATATPTTAPVPAPSAGRAAAGAAAAVKKPTPPAPALPTVTARADGMVPGHWTCTSGGACFRDPSPDTVPQVGAADPAYEAGLTAKLCAIKPAMC